ncbi:hypothetical protein ACFQVA_25355 [Actinomadura keratinilytica]
MAVGAPARAPACTRPTLPHTDGAAHADAERPPAEGPQTEGPPPPHRQPHPTPRHPDPAPGRRRAGHRTRGSDGHPAPGPGRTAGLRYDDGIAPGADGTPAPEAPRTGSAPLPEVPAEVFAPVGAGGLGRTAERSWRHLAAAAQGRRARRGERRRGLPAATVTRHLEGLAERGLARLDGERWYAVAPQGAPAPA